MRKVVKQFVKEWQKRWPETKLDNFENLIFKKDHINYIISVDYRRRGGDYYFYFKVALENEVIENQWKNYCHMLNCNKVIITTLSLLPLEYLIDFQEIGWGHRWDLVTTNMSEETFLNGLIDEYTIPLIERYSSIIEIDKTLNATDEVSECLKISPQFGLPFRKVLVAREAGNPRAKEIEENMRKWCEFKYNMIDTDEYQKAYIYVFEELFGKRR